MDNYKHIVLAFDQAQQPKFTEKKSKGYVEFGKDNDYPKYLIDLYSESPKHGAIVKGKSNYIYGKGFEEPGVANSLESWNDILKKCIKDDELFRGYYLQVIWNRAKQVSEVYHIDFAKVRVSKDLQTFYVKNDWNDMREKPREYEAFNVNNPYGSQIFYYKEYNPVSEIYPLPSYYQGLNYIESDIKVSRHILGNANQGWVGTKLVNLNNGDPIGEENKGEVERDLLKKFTGSEGKRVVIMFNKSRDNAADILDLGTTMLTKEDFTNVNNLIQQEIYACHQIISPTLFGISTPGSLGQRNEIRDSYEIFNNVYVNERQQQLEVVFTKFRNLKGEQGDFVIQPVEPLKFEFTEAIVSQNLTQDEIRELMGREPIDNAIKTQAQIISDNINALSPLVANKVLESMTPDEIRSLAGLVPVQQSTGTAMPNQEQPTQMNDSIKNLTGRQYQNVMRIVRQFGNGKLTKGQATLMLKNGFGFTDADVNTFLGVDDDPLTDDEITKFSMDADELLLQEFASCGSDRGLYSITETRSFNGFEVALNQLQADVLSLITKQPLIAPEVIAETLKKPLKDIEATIGELVGNKIITEKKTLIGEDEVVRRYVNKPVSELPGKSSKVNDILIMYSYDWRVPASQRDYNTSRPFCQRLMDLSLTKFWSRQDIENISKRVGYSVWDRCGGWWTMPDGTHSYQCRHEWKANIVTRKQK
jgi:hypothetical protein